jgi:hypothetical protein
MATPIFLYPSLTDEMKGKVSFQARAPYSVFYTNNEGVEKELDYQPSEIKTSMYCLKTDGVWNADKYNLCIKRSIALKHYRALFGPDGLACRNAKLGLSLVWTSSNSRQRGAEPIMTFSVSEEDLAARNDPTFAEYPLNQHRFQVNV